MNGNDIALNAPEQLHPGIHLKNLKEILAKLFSIQENVKQEEVAVLTAENTVTKEKKTAYKELLKDIIKAFRYEKIASQEEGRKPNFGYTDVGGRAHFNFDDQVVRAALHNYEFLKSGKKLDETKIRERMALMHKDDLHYKMARNNMRKFDETDKPYLDVDETGVVLKKAWKGRSGAYRDIQTGASSFD